MLGRQTPREGRPSAATQLGLPAKGGVTGGGLPGGAREVAKNGSIKKAAEKTPWRFSIIQEEPERGRSEEELRSSGVRRSEEELWNSDMRRREEVRRSEEMKKSNGTKRSNEYEQRIEGELMGGWVNGGGEAAVPKASVPTDL